MGSSKDIERTLKIIQEFNSKLSGNIGKALTAIQEAATGSQKLAEEHARLLAESDKIAKKVAESYTREVKSALQEIERIQKFFDK